METRKEFATGLVALLAAGTLTHFSVLAAGKGNGGGKGKDGCNGSASAMPDSCRGNGAKADGCTGGKFGNDLAPSPTPCAARNSDHAE